MTYQELESKIKSMSAKEIILAMVDSLQNPVTKIDMRSFGMKRDGICYGCAATNTICKLGNLDPEKEIVFNHSTWAKDYLRLYREDSYFIYGFEEAIDLLRLGIVRGYNRRATEYGFAKITYNVQLPRIDNINYTDPEILQRYIDLANNQPNV